MLLAIVIVGVIAVISLSFIDVNGNEKPNISGRDLFTFYVTPNGNVVDRSYVDKRNHTLSQKLNYCKNATNLETLHCFGALMDNNWKMDY